MDVALAAAAHSLSRGDPLDALRAVALRDDPPALALRGVSMAQLGEFATARKLLARAGRAFRGRNAGAHARCLAAEAEVALECRDLDVARRGFEAAIPLLEAAGDPGNAWFCRLQLARRLVLLGRLRDAGAALARLDPRGLPPRMHALVALLAADVAVRRVCPHDARVALGRALVAARAAGIPALIADVRRALDDLEAPVGRLVERGTERLVTLRDVARVNATTDVLVDTSRREVRRGTTTVSLVRRPVLLALAAALGESWPGAASRDTLIGRAFGSRLFATESMRVRLRVEIGRLRRALARVATVHATPDGFALVARGGRVVRVLHPPTDGAGTLLALLSGGEPWSTSALAAALGTSARTVQRALLDLESRGKVRGLGAGRARKWTTIGLPGFTTALLLVAQASRGVKSSS